MLHSVFGFVALLLGLTCAVLFLVIALLPALGRSVSEEADLKRKKRWTLFILGVLAFGLLFSWSLS
jgi:hypothetical protein